MKVAEPLRAALITGGCSQVLELALLAPGPTVLEGSAWAPLEKRAFSERVLELVGC